MYVYVCTNVCINCSYVYVMYENMYVCMYVCMHVMCTS